MVCQSCEVGISNIVLHIAGSSAEPKEVFFILCLVYLRRRFVPLRVERDRLNLNRGKVTCAMVVQAYDGNSAHGSTSIKQAAQTAMRHPPLVIDTTRGIAYQENLELHLTQEKYNNVGVQTAQQLKNLADCQLYCWLLPTSCCRSRLYSWMQLLGKEKMFRWTLFMDVVFFESDKVKPGQHTTVFFM